MKHLGDLTKINGAEVEPVDIITFGSPCQDLSVAGKREGMKGKRSGLFMEAVRIIREMREATNGNYPTWAIWENVPGAFSSNGGEDFRAVLEELCEAEIPMPNSGTWADAGMVRGGEREIAWRILDAQYWGVPQRRKRIFLVCDFGGQRASEVLFECESMSGNPAEGRETGEEAARDTGEGVEGAGESYCIDHVVTTGGNCTAQGPCYKKEQCFTLKASGVHAVAENVAQKQEPQLYDMTHAEEVMRACERGLAPTLNARMGTGGNQVPVLPVATFAVRTAQTSANDWGVSEDKAHTLDGAGGQAIAGPYWDGGEISDTLDCSMLGKQQMMPEKRRFAAVVEPPASVDCRNLYENEELSGTLQAKNTGGQSLNYTNPVRVGYKVRRLTPTECERLQGYPDGWTAGHSDSARYRAIGDSLAIPCVEWITGRVRALFLPPDSKRA